MPYFNQRPIFKILTSSAAFIVSLSSGASTPKIQDSNYEDRHQNLIIEAVRMNCGDFTDLKQIRAQQQDLQAEQGIRDTYFLTEFVRTKIDERGQSRDLKTVVESKYHDGYSHKDKAAGTFTVEWVLCY